MLYLGFSTRCLGKKERGRALTERLTPLGKSVTKPPEEKDRKSSEQKASPSNSEGTNDRRRSRQSEDDRRRSRQSEDKRSGHQEGEAGESFSRKGEAGRDSFPLGNVAQSPPEEGGRAPQVPPSDNNIGAGFPSDRARKKGLTGVFQQIDPRRLLGQTFFGWFVRTARLWGFLAFILIILILFRSVILPFILALLVAYVLAPLVRRLSEISIKGVRVPRFVWVILIYTALLGLATLFFTSFVPRLSKDIKRIVMEAPAFWTKAREEYLPSIAKWVETNFAVEQAKPPQPHLEKKNKTISSRVRLKKNKNGSLEFDLHDLQFEVKSTKDGHWVIRVPKHETKPKGSAKWVDSINTYLTDAIERSEDRVNRVIGLGQTFLLGILNAITTFILVLMISAFLLVDADRILRWFRNLVPKVYYEDFDRVIVLIDRGLSGAIRGQFIICIINGILTWIGLQIFDVKYPLLLSFLAAVMSLIPIFGSILSSIPIVIVALVSATVGVDILKGLLILSWIIAIHLLEANFLNPKIMGTAAKIHPVVVIFAVVAGERTYGPVGALLGVPLVSAVQAVFSYLRRKVRGETNEEEGESKTGSPPKQTAADNSA